MSSTRNKRKRPENDPGTATPASRRRSRDSRAAGDAATAAASSKNEANESSISGKEETATQKTEHVVSSSTAEMTTDKGTSNDKSHASKPPSEEGKSILRKPADPGSGSSVEGSAPKEALHLSAAESEAENTSRQNPDPEATERASKMRDLIAHRSLLLSRIRLCKSAADKRLNETKAATQSTIVEARLKTGDLSREMTDEEEIQAHREMAKNASLAAKRAGGEGEAEKRTSLSLRRGPSVGKRMNAALSSLVPRVASLTSMGAESPVPIQTTSAPGGKSVQKAPPSTGPVVPGNIILSAPKAPANPSMPNAPNIQIAKKAKGGSSQGNLSNRPSDGKQMRTTGGKASKSIAPSLPRTDPVPPSIRPGHPHANHANRSSQPKTNFTEAMLLRKRRDSLNAKLRGIMDKQKSRGSDVDNIRRSAAPNSRHSRFSSSSGLEIGPGEELPKRRKTHWDRLLQEMSWLATDFIEERKWKMASARTIGSAVLSSGPNLGPINAAAKKLSATALTTKAELEAAGDARSTVDLSEKSKNDLSVLEERKYLKPSSEDTRAARKSGRLMSSMISELALAMTRAGSMGNTDEFHIEALDRYKKVRAKLLNDGLSGSQSTSNQDAPVSTEDNPQCGEVSMDVDEKLSQTADTNGDSGEVTFSDINKRIRKLGLPSGKKDKFAFKDLASAVTGEKLHVSAEQKEMIEFVDGIWSTTSAGAMVSGLPTSGKTVATCSLLWKHRLDGPQLIICPPASMLRWKYEISLFKDLRVLNFGLVGGIGCAVKGLSFEKISPGPGDFVLCEYSSVGKLLELVRDKGVEFSSLCIDCRHPEGMFGCIGSDESKVFRNNKGWHGSRELITVDWWDNIMALAARNESPRRLMIDYCDPNAFSLDRSGLGQRQQLEIMSLRTAFLVGPRAFRPSNYPLPRTVISWARHQRKRDGEDKFDRVRRVLQETASPLSICIQKALSPSSYMAWDLRECEMPILQRQAYDSCCSHIRGALSSSLGAANTQDDLGPSTYCAVSTALFRLRQICLTSSSLEKVERLEPVSLHAAEALPFVNIEPCTVDATPTEAGSFKMASDNSSQPDVELAEVLLTSSAKLSELVSILRNECGYDLESGELVGDLIKSSGKGKQTESFLHRKVVIFANLPRTQWLVSILLGSLGLRHKLIRREFSRTFGGSNGDTGQHKQAALAWAESQNTLAAFNSESDTRDKMGVYDSADILIVSPDSLASWHGGIGVDSAGIIISLDEDWSGREMGILEASMSRWHASSSLRKSQSKMIRLICKSTIEEKIFKSSETNNASAIFQWPLDRSGNHLLYKGIDELVPIYQNATKPRHSKVQLPGLDILKLRGEPLDSVLLSSTELAPLFGKGSNMLFLPLDDGSDSRDNRDTNEMTRELFFLRSLFELECRETSKDLSESSTDSMTFTRKHHFGSGVLPPEPGLFPGQVMSRSDLQFLSIRYYLERQILLSERSSTGGVTLSRLSDSAENIETISGPLSDSSPQDGFAMADAWRKSGLGSKPDETAKTLLWYRPMTERKSRSQKATNISEDLTSGRFNAYSRLYSTTWDENYVRDGSQGCEPVVFFPPMQPKIQFAPAAITRKPAVLSMKELDLVTQQVLPSTEGGMAVANTVKRKEIETVHVGMEPGSKRPRTDALAADTISSEKESNVADETILGMPPGPSQIESRSPPLAQPSEKDKLLPPGKLEAEGDEDDDYGLLGRGVLPRPVDSALLLGNESTRVGERCGSDDFVSNVLVYDEELESFCCHDNEDALQLIALFVKRRPRNLLPIREQPGQPPYRPHAGLFHGDSGRANLHPLPTLDASTSLVPNREVNGDQSTRKPKNVTGQVAASAFTRIPSGAQIIPAPLNNTSHANGKDSHKHRMLATYVSRQFGTGLSMFESSSFRVAMMQIQKRVRKRVDMALTKSLLSSDAGSGLPLSALNQPAAISEFEQGIVHFSSFVQELKAGSNTGDAAKSLAATQRSTLRRSLVSPCRVDFGPFAGGYLSSPAGMTGISPPRSRLGVSLPMGVKVAQTTQDQAQPSWTKEEDKLLQEAAVRFGMNWIIVARALSGFEGFLLTSAIAVGPACKLAGPSRSARQCRDRWQSLARSQPSLANEVRKSEKILRENALKRADSMAREEGTSVRSSTLEPFNSNGKFVLLSKPSLYEHNEGQSNDMEIDLEPTCEPNLSANKVHPESEKKTTPPQPKRPISMLKAAMAKRQVVPLTIPGIPPGGQPNQPVPSHPSHMQSVQSSVAAQWSSGRTEMWPLQILDCADKHRATVRAASAAAAAAAAAQRASEPQQNNPAPASPSAASTTSARKPTTQGSGTAPTSSANHRSTTTAAGSTSTSRPTPTTNSRPASQSSPQKTSVATKKASAPGGQASTSSNNKSSSSTAKKSDKSKAPSKKT